MLDTPLESAVPDTVARRDRAGRAEPVSLRTLFLCFLRAGVVGLAGDPTVRLERDLVERRRWLSPAGFRSLRILSRVVPGLPSVNLAVAVGRRLGGGVGALVAALGLLAAPAFLAVLLGLLYSRWGSPQAPGVADAATAAARPFLSGLAVAGAGLAAAAGVSGIRRIGLTPGHAAVLLFMVGALTVWHWPVALVVLVALPLSVLVTRFRKTRETGDA